MKKSKDQNHIKNMTGSGSKTPTLFELNGQVKLLRKEFELDKEVDKLEFRRHLKYITELQIFRDWSKDRINQLECGVARELWPEERKLGGWTEKVVSCTFPNKK